MDREADPLAVDPVAGIPRVLAALPLALALRVEPKLDRCIAEPPEAEAPAVRWVAVRMVVAVAEAPAARQMTPPSAHNSFRMVVALVRGRMLQMMSRSKLFETCPSVTAGTYAFGVN